MAEGGAVEKYLAGLPAATRAVAERIVGIVETYARLDSAIKWRQLTFAVDSDFDHWVCAVAGTKRGVNLTFHFGSMLRAEAGAFAPSDAEYVRKITYDPGSDVDEHLARDLLTQALEALPRFRAMRRDLAGPTRRRS